MRTTMNPRVPLLLFVLVGLLACGGGSTPCKSSVDCATQQICSDGACKPMAPSELAYAANPAVYSVGSAIAANTPTSSGGPVKTYSVSPELPAGLTLDSVTGVIGGTPTTVTPVADYVVRACNDGGTTTVTLSITVGPPLPPTIVGQPGDVRSLSGDAGVQMECASGEVCVRPYDKAVVAVMATGVEPLSYQWLKNDQPIEGATAASYTTPSIDSKEEAGAIFSVVVTDGYGQKVASSGAMLRILPGFWRAASMMEVRSGHTATLLSNGKVLVTGGRDTYGDELASTEVYDPEANTWSSASPMLIPVQPDTPPRLLTDGRVLFIKNRDQESSVSASAQTFDPATNLWAPVTPPTDPIGWASVVLKSGRVLIVCDEMSIQDRKGSPPTCSSGAQLYDPQTDRWSHTGAMAHARNSPSAVVLADGRVLVTGGWDTEGPGTIGFSFAETYTEPSGECGEGEACGEWKAAKNMWESRLGHSLTLLPDGRVVAIGGTSLHRAPLSAEIYEPDKDRWSKPVNLPETISYVVDVRDDGDVLLYGTGALAVYSPGTGQTRTLTNTMGDLSNRDPTMTRLMDGRVLIAWGEVQTAAGSSATGAVVILDPNSYPLPATTP